MDHATQIEVFGKMYANGHIYRGKKPVHWSPSSRTALAEAELEYPEGHTSRSIYVAMSIVAPSDDMPSDLKVRGRSTLHTLDAPERDCGSRLHCLCCAHCH